MDKNHEVRAEQEDGNQNQLLIPSQAIKVSLWVFSDAKVTCDSDPRQGRLTTLH